MAVLTNIPNNTSARDWRDTVNALIKRIAALEAAGVPVETPAPAFTTQPSISPTSGTAGSTVYAATPGTISNGSVVSRAWLLNGVAISNGVTAVPSSSGTLTYQETASGPGGTTTSSVQVAAVTAATTTPTPAPAFTSQPSISPASGTAGTTTFTATAGNVSNGSVTSRSWTINGTVISTGLTASPASSGTLTYQETATGPGGTTQSTVQQVTVATAAAAAPAFTTQPTVSPSTGTAGTTTYTATPGAVSNGTITSRAWSLNGSVISTGLTAAPASAGTLTYQEFASGSGGSASSSILTRTVSAASTAFAGYDVILLGGQSNMVGRYGPVDATLDATDDRIMQYGYDSQTVTLASNPLDSRDEGADTVGMGMSIAKAYIAAGLLAAGRKLLLVNPSMGNTAFNTGFWRAGGSGDTQAIARANAAMAIAGGTNQLAMIAWHQGEGDRTSSQATYAADLDALITRWRSSITGANNAPFIVGGLLVGGAQTTTAISAALADLPNRVAFTAFVDSSGLTSGGDNLHFDAASQRTLGGRYYSVLATAKANNLAPTAPAQVTGLSATPSSGQVALAWIAPSNNRSAITDYIVQYKASTSSTWLTFADGTSTALTATVTGLSNGTVYDFRVSAVNAIGTGTPSATLSATPAAAPAGGLNATFTGADNTPAASYTTDSGHTISQTSGVSQIRNNALAGTTVPSEGTFSYAPPTINQTIKWRTIVNTKAGNCYIRYRVVDGSNYYYAGCGSNGAFHTLASFVAGTASNFAGATTATPAFAAGDTLDYELTITGAAGSEVHTLKVSVNGATAVQVFSGSPPAATQSTLSAPGLIGFRQSSAASSATAGLQLDNITATAI